MKDLVKILPETVCVIGAIVLAAVGNIGGSWGFVILGMILYVEMLAE